MNLMRSPQSNRKALRVIALAVAMAAATVQANDPPEAPEPALKIVADGGTTYDGATGRLVVISPRISHGDFELRADRGASSSPDSDWLFTGNVRFRALSATLECDSAELRFNRNRLQRAVILGNPARMKNEGERVAEGSALRIEYEAETALVRLLGGAELETGELRLRGESITFDLRAETFNVAPGEGEGERVELTIDALVPDLDEVP